VLSNHTHLFLSYCVIGDDEFVALVSALEQNTSLLHLEWHHSPFSHSPGFSERAILALAMSLPDIKTLQRLNFSLCTGLVSAMPLLVGLRKNKSLFRLHVANCARSHQQLKTRPDVPAVGCRKWSGWGTGTAFSL
jgi:hypothetical protein